MANKGSSQLSFASSLIKQASYTVAFTGAGISTPSGIPDFRSPGTGLWEKNDPYEVASLTAFRSHPEKFFNWIRPLFLQARDAEPNPAHIYLSKLEQAGVIKSIITQNIDGLHQDSGGQNVIELHGSAKTATCPQCSSSYSTDEVFTLLQDKNNLPMCTNCGEVIKPDVILFGEMLPEKAWFDAQNEMLKAKLVLAIGSSLEVYPANSLLELAVNNGAKLIINTLSRTPMDRFADVTIQQDVEEVIPELYWLLQD